MSHFRATRPYAHIRQWIRKWAEKVGWEAVALRTPAAAARWEPFNIRQCFAFDTSLPPVLTPDRAAAVASNRGAT